jgi:quercetin dioxygenase-like cupin family protein
MTSAAFAEPHGLTETAPPLWFLGTLVHLKLTSRQTGGRFGLWEGVLPRGAAPPLHSHPQDETFYVLDGEVTVWLVARELAEDRDWVKACPRRCGTGDYALAPGGTPHAFRVESDTARNALRLHPCRNRGLRAGARRTGPLAVAAGTAGRAARTDRAPSGRRA